MHTSFINEAVDSLEKRPKIRASNVGKQFLTRRNETVDALTNVNLTVEDKQFCTIVGPSGCGKTTLLRIIAGLETLTTGEIEVTEEPGKPTNAMVFQEQSIFPWFTVEQNVSYGLKSMGMRGAELQDRVDYWIEKARLSQFKKAYPYQLSGGMKQRASLARALAMEPGLILMDEPFAALDEQTKLILQNELLRLWQASESSVVFVTHSIDEAVALSDKVVVMSNRPATVRMEVDIPLERPRDVIEIKAEPMYGELVGQIWEAIRNEVQEVMGA